MLATGSTGRSMLNAGGSVTVDLVAGTSAGAHG
jgi:hypothetical protein